MRISVGTGMNGMIEPGPVSGVSRYSHFVSAKPGTSVSRSKVAEVPACVTAPEGPVVPQLGTAPHVPAGPWPAPLVKSSSMAHTALVRPTSPVMKNTPRSRENHSRSCALVGSRADQLSDTLEWNSNSPVIVTFGAGTGAGTWADTEGATTPRRATTETATARNVLITASSCGGPNAGTAHVGGKRAC